jgi:hypothetical protein
MRKGNKNRDPLRSAFARSRKIVIKRDGNKCRKCGSSIAIEVHHILGYTENDPINLVTLCSLCHNIAPMGTEEYWEWEKNGQVGCDNAMDFMMSKFSDVTKEQWQGLINYVKEYDTDHPPEQARIW